MRKAILRAETFTTDELLEQLRVAEKQGLVRMVAEICWAIAEHVIAEE